MVYLVLNYYFNLILGFTPNFLELCLILYFILPKNANLDLSFDIVSLGKTISKKIACVKETGHQTRGGQITQY